MRFTALLFIIGSKVSVVSASHVGNFLAFWNACNYHWMWCFVSDIKQFWRVQFLSCWFWSMDLSGPQGYSTFLSEYICVFLKKTTYIFLYQINDRLDSCEARLSELTQTSVETLNTLNRLIHYLGDIGEILKFVLLSFIEEKHNTLSHALFNKVMRYAILFQQVFKSTDSAYRLSYLIQHDVSNKNTNEFIYLNCDTVSGSE